jgi:hypothetical protein
VLRSNQLSYPAIFKPGLGYWLALVRFSRTGRKYISFSKVLKYFLLIDAIFLKLALVDAFITQYNLKLFILVAVFCFKMMIYSSIV